jgi:hypothetical protein
MRRSNIEKCRSRIRVRVGGLREIGKAQEVEMGRQLKCAESDSGRAMFELGIGSVRGSRTADR